MAALQYCAIVGVVIVPAAIGSRVMAQPAIGYVPLKLDGRYVAWPVGDSGKLRLTWSITSEQAHFARTINCTDMAPLGALDDKISLERMKIEIVAAFKYWEASTPIEFSYSPDWRKANIVVGAQLHPAGIAYADVIHEPEPQADRGRIVKSLICLNPLARWKTSFDGNLKTHDLRYVIAHEIGHAIGLDHPSASGQLMSFRYEERFREPQSGDRAGVNSLYGKRANIH